MEGTKLQTEGRTKETLKGQETQEGMEIKKKIQHKTQNYDNRTLHREHESTVMTAITR